VELTTGLTNSFMVRFRNLIPSVKKAYRLA
jgi:hypothetical protein